MSNSDKVTAEVLAVLAQAYPCDCDESYGDHFDPECMGIVHQVLSDEYPDLPDLVEALGNIFRADERTIVLNQVDTVVEKIYAQSADDEVTGGTLDYTDLGNALYVLRGYEKPVTLEELDEDSDEADAAWQAQRDEAYAWAARPPAPATEGSERIRRHYEALGEQVPRIYPAGTAPSARFAVGQQVREKGYDWVGRVSQVDITPTKHVIGVGEVPIEGAEPYIIVVGEGGSRVFHADELVLVEEINVEGTS